MCEDLRELFNLGVAQTVLPLTSHVYSPSLPCFFRSSVFTKPLHVFRISPLQDDKDISRTAMILDRQTKKAFQETPNFSFQNLPESR